jgi:uncharacterized delta-60 repeat protein
MNLRIISFTLHIFLTSFMLFAAAVSAAPGDFDPTFGSNGQVINTIPGVGQATGVAIQADGKIVLASSSFNASGNFDFAVLRLNPDGSPDSGFGTGGKVVIPFDNFANEEAVAIAVQPDGKIVVVGYAEFGSPGYDSRYDFRRRRKSQNSGHRNE